MRNFHFVGAALVLAVFAGQARAEDKLLLSFNYYLRANVNYVTGLYAVNGANVQTSQVKIMQSGSSYCDLRISQVEYTTFNGDYARNAKSVGGAVYEIPDGTVRALNIHFSQNYWDKVDCTLTAYAIDGGSVSPGEDERYLGVVMYKGGFVDKAYVDAEGGIKSFRFGVPLYCKDLEVLQAGTIVDGVYYGATKAGKNAFRVNPAGSAGASRIAVSLNGPHSLECDVPVYGRFERRRPN